MEKNIKGTKYTVTPVNAMAATGIQTQTYHVIHCLLQNEQDINMLETDGPEDGKCSTLISEHYSNHSTKRRCLF